MKAGLVLGAGGVLGGAWLTGALSALAHETDWDPGSADYVVGTSAGAMIGALLSAGVPPWFMVAHSRGESFEGLTGPDGRPAAEADRAAGAVFRIHRGIPGIGPGSLRMAFTALSNPLRHTPLQLLAGWLPAGLISTEPLKEVVGRAVDGRWVEHPNFWAVACDYGSGRRVPFGREGSPPARVADAVAASCAIPGVYRPVEIGGRRYVDGGVCSASSMDLLAGRGLDLVICLNPLSGAPGSPADPRDWLGVLSRGANGRRLEHEAGKVRRLGTEVVTIEPTADDLKVMGRNLMSTKRRQQVIETAERTVLEQLRRRPGTRELLSDLPPGEPHRVRRPEGPPSTWPPIARTAPARGRRAA